jgi:diadenosine tetraphosphatase ApaH/serine/threonine PP2A family protein phosphatase
MTILVISDIHANRTALEAVLEDAGSFDEVWCLGDVVGYGPDPNSCVEIVRDLPDLICLRGNHDSAVAGLAENTKFNPTAQKALEWTERELKAGNITYIKELPTHTEMDEVTLAHGSPRDPVWEYIMDPYTATANFDFFSTPYCLVGHSHIPFLYVYQNEEELADKRVLELGEAVELPSRSLLNPGSVGQPRDNDPRASYALFEPEKRTWIPHRVAYDVEAVQTRMKEAGLPLTYIQRIAHGW